MSHASWVATEGRSGATDWDPNMEIIDWGLDRSKSRPEWTFNLHVDFDICL